MVAFPRAPFQRLLQEQPAVWRDTDLSFGLSAYMECLRFLYRCKLNKENISRTFSVDILLTIDTDDVLIKM